ncbi:MAG: NUDIX domain-containing protein [Parachlamydiaceae bacterium]|nr:NUDIX domain-containing protein [Parachlamydiaceae bacterium]
MNNNIELPSLRGENLYIPFVGAIIENIDHKKKQILIQIRSKESDPIFSGCFEIPGGKLKAFEDAYETVRREVKEECGLNITSIEDEDKRVDYQNQNNSSTLIQPYCITQMQNGPFIGLIFLCHASGIPLKLTAETKEARWIDVDELDKIIKNSPEKIYTVFLAPLKKYLSETISPN